MKAIRKSGLFRKWSSLKGLKINREDIFDLSKVSVNPTIRSHANDPFVRRKVEEAKRVLAPYLKELADERELADKSK